MVECLLYSLDIFCGTAPIDPNAVATGSGLGPSASIIYTCLPGYEDSNDPKNTYTRTCSGGNWNTGADSCSSESCFFFMSVILNSAVL